MSFRKLGILSCRIISIYALIKLVMYLQNIIISFAYIEASLPTNRNWFLLSSIIPAIMLFVLSIVFWVFASAIAKKMLKDKGQEASLNNEIDYEKLEILAFAIIGLVILSSAIPNLAKASIDMHALRLSHVIGFYRDDPRFLHSLSQVIGPLIQLVIGCWLFLGSRGIVGLIKTLRKA